MVLGAEYKEERHFLPLRGSQSRGEAGSQAQHCRVYDTCGAHTYGGAQGAWEPGEEALTQFG